MTASMRALVRRMAARVSGCPERVLVNSAPEFSALRMAWRERSAAHAGEGRWKGPGYYRLSGFYDGPRSMATVEFDSPHPQGELPGLR